MVNVDEINDWLTSAEACERLGIRPQTLYAYVSRGRLVPRKQGRRSLFDVRQLDELSARSRRTNRTGRLEVLIDTELTLLDPGGRLAYRGIDIADIAMRWSYERTAEWLWSSADREPPAWIAPPPWLAAVRAAGGSTPTARLRVGVAVIASLAQVPVGPVTEVGRSLIAALAEGLPPIGAPTRGLIAGIDRDDHLAGRLWPRLTALAPSPERLAVLNAALVVLADHEMAVSAVAARVAASAWAPPVDTVLAAMATHGGALHGGATTVCEQALRDGGDLRSGFGHGVYESTDPRAELLLGLLERLLPAARWRPIARALRQGDHPNVDLALAAVSVAFDMEPGSAQAIFAQSRVAGWLAHAAEEYERPFRFRARASYVGEPVRRPTTRMRLNA